MVGQTGDEDNGWRILGLGLGFGISGLLRDASIFTAKVEMTTGTAIRKRRESGSTLLNFLVFYLSIAFTIF